MLFPTQRRIDEERVVEISMTNGDRIRQMTDEELVG